MVEQLVAEPAPKPDVLATVRKLPEDAEPAPSVQLRPDVLKNENAAGAGSTSSSGSSLRAERDFGKEFMDGFRVSEPAPVYGLGYNPGSGDVVLRL